MTKIRLTRAILAAASFNLIAATAAWADADYALHCDRKFGIRANGSLPFTGTPSPAEYPQIYTVRFTGTESTRLDKMNRRTTFKNLYLESSTGTDYGGEIKDSPQRASHIFGPETRQGSPAGVRWAYSEQWKAFTLILDYTGSEFLCDQKPVEQRAERPVDPKPYDIGEANGTRWTSIILNPSKIGDRGIAGATTRTEYDNKPPTHADYMIGCSRDNQFVARTDNVPEGDDAPAISIKRTSQPPKKHRAEYRLWAAVCANKFIEQLASQDRGDAKNASEAQTSVINATDAESAKPSFDCSKAKAADEIAICSDPRLARLDQLQAFAFSKAKYHPKKAEIVKTTREYLRYRRDCGSKSNCIRAFQRELIHNYIDAGLSFSLPSWASAEGISADAACIGVFTKDYEFGPGTKFKKGEEMEFMAYRDEGGERSYSVFRLGTIKADSIRLKDSNCVLRREETEAP